MCSGRWDVGGKGNGAKKGKKGMHAPMQNLGIEEASTDTKLG